GIENDTCTLMQVYALPISLKVVFCFQAEDGIRDSSVTGVQTCALPISAPTVPQEPPAPEPEEPLHTVRSPIVGTFYEAPSPGAPPFVKVGDLVEVGQVLCIVEAMKLMNEIESDVAGEVVKKLVANGQPIEYGQELFVIRPKS